MKVDETNSQLLTLSLRPRNLGEIIGQREIVQVISEKLADGVRAPRAYLFHGPAGCGKTTLARIIALSFQCTHEAKPCFQCWERYTDFAIHEKNASETNGVEEASQLAEISKLAPLPPSRKRVLILDEAQMLTVNAQNLLLKPFEDAPPSTVWIICTTDPRKILPALRRRCFDLALRPLGDEGRKKLVARAAKSAKWTASCTEFISTLEEHQINSPALVLMAFEKLVAGMAPVAAVLGATLGGNSTTETLAICKAVTGGDVVGLLKVLLRLAPEESRLARASVVGWLRNGLLKGMAGNRKRLYAEALIELNHMVPLDDATLYSWLVGQLVKLTLDFGKV